MLLPSPTPGAVPSRSPNAGSQPTAAMQPARPGRALPMERRGSPAMPSSMDFSSRRNDGRPSSSVISRRRWRAYEMTSNLKIYLRETCVRVMAESYVRMAAALGYENRAALKEHRRRDRELEERIAAANPQEAARLRDERTRLRRVGLWRPTLPGEREGKAILRYLGRIDRTIQAASSQLILQKQTHFSATPRSGPEARRPTPNDATSSVKSAKTNPLYPRNCGVFGEPGGPPTTGREARPALTVRHAAFHAGGASKFAVLGAPSSFRSQKEAREATEEESAKTNPLSSMFTGNRHERRRAQALERRH